MIPELLRSWRASHAWTQAQAADALGVDLRTYQDWEQGRRNPAHAATGARSIISSLTAKLNAVRSFERRVRQVFGCHPAMRQATTCSFTRWRQPRENSSTVISPQSARIARR